MKSKASRMKKVTTPFRSGGFTLIELLIVIAIILILIAIALPNFLEAQIRARVTKASGEIRSIVTAQESYFLDWKVYPAESEDDAYRRPRTSAGLYWLTAPIAYMTSIPDDPFASTATDAGADPPKIRTYETGGVRTMKVPEAVFGCLEMYAIFSRGPGGDESIESAHPNYPSDPNRQFNHYAPTNGTKSLGDIFHYGGDGFWVGVAIDVANKTDAKNRPIVPVVSDGVPYVHRLPRGLY